MTFETMGLAEQELPPTVDSIEMTEQRFVNEDGLEIVMNQYEPVGVESSLVMWCLPCGGCSRNYFDFKVEGAEAGSYSFARYVARRGITVITADHIGVGDSTHIPNRPELTTANFLADRMHEAVTAFKDRPQFSGKTFVGVGHSFGSGMLLTQQYRHQAFSALVVLGWSSIQIALMYTDGQFKALGTPGARARSSETNLGFKAPQELIDANRSIATTVVLPAVQQVGEAGWCVPASRSVRVPVYLGFGEFDTVLDLQAEVQLYIDAPEVVTAVLPGSYHFHNLAEGRQLLWSGIIDFANRQVAS
ncbi:MAG: alpha/beta fold hydrolase [Actinomycetota bacterium]|nr:alpha/beta fold hydrolase [Actinomycetota bacterium]MDP2289281.1 alpha/beta fold hydrolase [Actinomycetota bacterium]